MTTIERHEIASVRAWYDRIAERFNARYSGISGEFWQRFEERIALELLDAPVERVLDLGCGTGRLAAVLSARAKLVLGADISEAMIAIAQGAPHAANVNYSLLDATQAPLEDASFDAVISLGMFEYMSDPSPFLREIRRILRPGGRVIFTCHGHPPLPVWAWMMGEAVLRRIVRGGRRSRGLPNSVRHRPKDMLRILGEEGFEGATFRGFHFPPAANAFWIASAIPIARVAGAGKRAAAAMDRRLGRGARTRALCPLAMYVATRPR